MAAMTAAVRNAGSAIAPHRMNRDMASSFGSPGLVVGRPWPALSRATAGVKGCAGLADRDVELRRGLIAQGHAADEDEDED
jgi:hypothetical protein